MADHPLLKIEAVWSPKPEEFPCQASILEGLLLSRRLANQRASDGQGTSSQKRTKMEVKKEPLDMTPTLSKTEESEKDGILHCPCQRGVKDPKCIYGPINPSEPVDPKTAQRCCVCYHSYPSKDVYDEHMAVHKGQKEFQCHVCLEIFHEIFALLTHSNLHQGPLSIGECKLVCPICMKEFTKKSAFDDHLMKHEMETKCKHCCEVFPDKRSFNYHLRTQCAKEEFECTLCDKSFLTKGNLKQHMVMHSKEKAFYRCHLCGERFLRPIMRHKHLLKHLAQNSIFL